MKLYQIIKEYRRDHDVTLDELAKRSGLSKPYISMLEKGMNPKSGKPIIPSYDTLRKLAIAMDMKTVDFIKLIDSEQRSIHLESRKSPMESNDLGVVLDELSKRLHCGRCDVFHEQPLNDFSRQLMEQAIWHFSQTAELLCRESKKIQK